ncbi:2-phosphosulfolactate phosphatase [Nanoarchaeota archaeon]
MLITVDNLVEGARHAEGLVVIADIFRHTTFQATLLHLGASAIYPVTDPEMANILRDALTFEGRKAYLGGEMNGQTPDFYDFNHSPLDIMERADEINGNPVVVTSTNGALGIRAAAEALHEKAATEVLTACFHNYLPVAQYILAKNPDKVTIVGMGEILDPEIGRVPSPEDEGFAWALKAFLEGEDPLLDQLTYELQSCVTADMMREIFGPGIEKEIAYCLNHQIQYNVVPRLDGARIVNAYETKPEEHKPIPEEA